MRLLSQILSQIKRKLRAGLKYKAKNGLQNYIYLIAVLFVISLSLHLFKSAPEEAEDLPHYTTVEMESSSERVSAELLRVVDGDTIVVGIDQVEYKIRLIGIDTPESVHSDSSKNNEYGQMASDYAKELLENQETVWIEYDQEVEDRYGRQLGYVWLDPAEEDLLYMLNYILVVNGYAVNKEFPPNTRYADCFQEACCQAMNENTGLWIYEGFQELW